MTDEQPTPWVHEDLVSTIVHALRHQGRKVTHDVDRPIAQAAAEGVAAEAPRMQS